MNSKPMRFVHLLPLLAVAACGSITPAPNTSHVPEVVAAPKAEAAPAVIEQPVPPPSASRLTGLNPGETQALLGEPSLVRRDANVQVMLFEGNECVFEVIFYEPNEDEHFAATETNARTRRGTDMDRTVCLMKILPNSRWLDQQ